MNFLHEAVIALNRLFPRTNVRGRDSPDAYSQWEYDVGRQVFRQHFGEEVLRDKTVLDVGCGMGGKTIWYAEVGAQRVIGVDIAPKHTSQAFKFVEQRGFANRVHILQGNAMRLPFRDGSFSALTANDSMEHFADPAAALRELARILKPGGRLFLYFTPYLSPLGSHLYDHVKFPWCQLLLNRQTLYATLRRSILEEERQKGPEDLETRTQVHFEETVRYFENDINGITVQKFHEIVDQEPRLHLRKVSYVVPKYGFLSFLTRVPKIREYFTGLVFADLERLAPQLRED